MSDDRALRRALYIERRTVKMYERKLRDLLNHQAYSDFRQFCRREAIAGCEANSGKIDRNGTAVAAPMPSDQARAAADALRLVQHDTPLRTT